MAAADAAAGRLTRWLKLGFALLLVPLTIVAFRDEYGRIPLLGDLDLAVHEFGHYLFAPFGFAFAGETMVTLGGSLFQIVFPLIFALYFLRARKDAPRDLFAVAICLWWAALNMLDVSIYMADARAGQLMLLTGATAEDGSPHDWRILFSQWGVLRRDTFYASQLRGLAGLLAFGALTAAITREWFRRPVVR